MQYNGIHFLRLKYHSMNRNNHVSSHSTSENHSIGDNGNNSNGGDGIIHRSQIPPILVTVVIGEKGTKEVVYYN
jgi:hypothetical protein